MPSQATTFLSALIVSPSTVPYFIHECTLLFAYHLNGINLGPLPRPPCCSSLWLPRACTDYQKRLLERGSLPALQLNALLLAEPAFELKAQLFGRALLDHLVFGSLEKPLAREIGMQSFKTRGPLNSATLSAQWYTILGLTSCTVKHANKEWADALRKRGTKLAR